MKHGIVYGVSVGPGDPSLLTLKAAERIRLCPVLAVPRTSGAHSLALSIAAGAVDLAAKAVEYLDLPMTRDPELRERAYRAVADQIARHLGTGADVAVLNLGDASLYSSWSYLCRILLDDGWTAETIPGVTSFCACAARLNRSLTEMNEPLHILPGALEDLEAALALPGGKIVMKSGKSLPQVLELLARQGLTDRAALVSDCGLPTEQAFPRIEEVPCDSYFSTLLIAP